jgi:predicted TIM-barrel fold metal-dependent hydrolase
MNDNDGLVDVHAHFTTDGYIDHAKAAGHNEPDGMPEGYWPQWSAFRHLELMDQTGIARAMLSLSSPGVHFGNDAVARSLAREVNETSADIIREHPQRFGHFVSLPLPDIDGSLAEIAYCYEELDADGVIMMTNYAGVRLGDNQLHPVLAELDRRAAVILLHPTSCAGHEQPSCGRPRPMIEFLFDTARTVVDFILGGAAEHYPQVRLIVPHLGSVLPLLADRVELFRSISGEPHDRTTVAEILGRFYYDLAGTPSDSQIAALNTIAQPDRLLYGSDYAWTRHDQVLRAMTTLDGLLDADGDTWRARTTRNAYRLLT